MSDFYDANSPLANNTIEDKSSIDLILLSGYSNNFWILSLLYKISFSLGASGYGSRLNRILAQR